MLLLANLFSHTATPKLKYPMRLIYNFHIPKVYEALFALSFSFLSERFSTLLELIFTAAVKRGVVPHTRKQRVLAAISKLRSAYFTGYKNKSCTYYI